MSEIGPATDEAFRHQMGQFFDATTDAIFFLDRDYRFTFLNRRAHELLASGGEDILGTVLFERYPATVYEGSPYVSAYTGSMERGEVGDFEAYYPEPFNFWLRVQSYPADHGIIVFFRDITRDRALKQEMEHQLAELETVYRTAPIGLALFDAKEYRYVRLNDIQASFFGLKAEDVVGKVLTDLAPIPGLRELFDKVAAGEPVINYALEGSLITDPDTYRYWTVNYFPVYAADGSITGITAASLEITHQKKSEDALIQSEKLAVVGRLAASIAHEINNPLEAVTNLQYLAETSEDMVEAREYLRLAGIELRRVAAITAQTLRFHKQATRPQEVLAEELMASVLALFHSKLANAQVNVLERYRAHQAVCCFEGEIRQVLSNLVSNGLDAMNGRRGNLFLRTSLSRRWTDEVKGIVITIADSGAGMTEGTLAKLFQPFFTTKGITGTGLGLWVSKEIIDRHEGTVRVRSSQAVQRSGTVFRLFLPRETAAVLTTKK